MGNFLIKPDPDEDFYVEWTTYTDSPIAYGDRAEFQEYDPTVYTDERFERCDRNGSSYMLRCGWWDDEELQLLNVGTSNNWWNLPRKHLKEVAIGLVQNYDNREKQQEFIDKYCTEIVFED